MPLVRAIRRSPFERQLADARRLRWGQFAPPRQPGAIGAMQRSAVFPSDGKMPARAPEGRLEVRAPAPIPLERLRPSPPIAAQPQPAAPPLPPPETPQRRKRHSPTRLSRPADVGL
jgi:hypothetical protein